MDRPAILKSHVLTTSAAKRSSNFFGVKFVMGSNQAPSGDPGILISIFIYQILHPKMTDWSHGFLRFLGLKTNCPVFAGPLVLKGSTKGSIEPETQKQQTQYLSQAKFKRKVVCNHCSKGPCSAASCFALFTQSWGPG